MLEFIRRGVKSWVAKALLILLIISFAVWGLEGIFSSQGGGAVARVGDRQVNANEFALRLQRLQNRLIAERREAVSLGSLREQGADRVIVQEMILQAAFAEEAARLDVAIPDDAVRQAILNDPTFQDGQGAFNRNAYGRFLDFNTFDQESFEDFVRQRLRQQILSEAVGPGAVAPTGMAERIAAWRGERRSVAMMVLDPALAPDPGTPDAAALQAFFAANEARFQEPERRWGQYLHIDVRALVEDMMPPEDEVRAEYEANTERYAVPAARTVEQITFADEAGARAAAERLAAGTASFEEIAAERNVALEDLSLGTIEKGDEDVSEATRDAVFALEEPGIAGPVETLVGNWALLNVTEVTKGGAPPFDRIKDRIARQMAFERAGTAVPDLAARIDEMRAAGAVLSEIAAETGIPLITFEGLAADRTVAEGEVPPLAVNRAFMADLAEALVGEERDLLNLDDGGYALIMVERIEKTHLPALADIEDEVAAAWAAEQRLLATEQTAEGLIAETPEGGVAALAADRGLDLVEPQPFTRERPPVSLSADLRDAIFAAKDGEMVVGRDRTGAQVIVAEVRAITPLEGADLEAAVAETQTALEAQVLDDQLTMYARAVRDSYEITINEDAIGAVFERLGAARTN